MFSLPPSSNPNSDTLLQAARALRRSFAKIPKKPQLFRSPFSRPHATTRRLYQDSARQRNAIQEYGPEQSEDYQMLVLFMVSFALSALMGYSYARRSPSAHNERDYSNTDRHVRDWPPEKIWAVETVVEHVLGIGRNGN